MRGFIVGLVMIGGVFACEPVSADGICYPKWYIGSNTYGGNDRCICAVTNVDTLLEKEESIWLTLSSLAYCSGECSTDGPADYSWIHNGDTVHSPTLLVEDTGTYIGIIKYSGCGPGLFKINMHVGYKPAPGVTKEENEDVKLFIYPTLSTGIFNIKSSEALSEVMIRDSAGKIVFALSENVTAIDLSHLREGLYFYYLKDKAGHSHVGRLVKR